MYVVIGIDPILQDDADKNNDFSTCAFPYKYQFSIFQEFRLQLHLLGSSSLFTEWRIENGQKPEPFRVVLHIIEQAQL